jgi:hypothetical protein
MDRGNARLFLVLALLLAASVVLSAFQCVSVCASDACAPPCHSHSHDSICPQQAVVAVLVAAPHIAPEAVVTVAFVLPPVETDLPATVSTARILALPPLNLFNSLVLRT